MRRVTLYATTALGWLLVAGLLLPADVPEHGGRYVLCDDPPSVAQRVAGCP